MSLQAPSQAWRWKNLQPAREAPTLVSSIRYLAAARGRLCSSRKAIDGVSMAGSDDGEHYRFDVREIISSRAALEAPNEVMSGRGDCHLAMAIVVMTSHLSAKPEPLRKAVTAQPVSKKAKEEKKSRRIIK